MQKDQKELNLIRTATVRLSSFSSPFVETLLDSCRNPEVDEVAVQISESALSLPGCSSEALLETLKQYCAALKEHKKIKQFEFLATGSSRLSHDEIAKAILEGLENNYSLFVLDLKGLMPSSLDFELLRKVLYSLRQLEDLRIDMKLDEDQIVKLAWDFSRRPPFGGKLTFRNNCLTDNIVATIQRLPEEVSVEFSQKNLSTQNTNDEYRINRQQWRSFTEHNRFSSYKPPYERTYITIEQWRAFLRYCQTQPYTELVPGKEIEFTRNVTGNLALSQLMKPGNLKIWQESHSTTGLTQNKIPFQCGWTRYLDPIFINSPTPMSKTEAERYLDAQYGDHNRFFIIDHVESNKIHKIVLAGQKKATRMTRYLDCYHLDANFPANPLASPEDILHCLRIISPDLKHLNFFSCKLLDYKTLYLALKKFSQLEFLGLRHIPRCGDDESHVKKLVELCGDNLTGLEIQLQEPSAIAALAQFKRLTNLYLAVLVSPIIDLDCLIGAGRAITVLHLVYCTKLRDFSSLQHCPALTEICFYGMIIADLSGLIRQLSRLRHLQLVVLHACQFPGLSESRLSSIVAEMQYLLPHIFISVDPTIPAAPIKNYDLLAHLKKQLPVQNSGPLRPALIPALRCEAFTTYPSITYRHSQIFWLAEGKGEWPAQLHPRLDRHFVLDHFGLNAQGSIIMAPPADLKLQPVTGVVVMESHVMHRRFLSQYEQEFKGRCYGAQLEVTVSHEWQRVPSRGVFPRPFACSLLLEWARSMITGELFVRLPQSSALAPGNLFFRYAAAFNATDWPDFRNIKARRLPMFMHMALSQLSRGQWLIDFPRWGQLVAAMQTLKDHKPAVRSLLIKRYCQIGGPGGFTGEVCDPQVIQLVRGFVNSLNVGDLAVADSLTLILVTLLQQRGSCFHAVQTAKLLADYCEVPFQVIANNVHLFYNDHSDSGRVWEGDLGGIPPTQENFYPLSKESLDPPPDLPNVHELLAQENQLIKTIENEFKPVLPLGYTSTNATAYWRMVLDCRKPLIQLSPVSKVQKSLASLVEFMDGPGKNEFSRKRFFCMKELNDDKQPLTVVRVADGKEEEVNSWLTQTLTQKKPAVVVIFGQASYADLMEAQPVADEERTFKGITLPPHIHVIYLASPSLLREDIFLARFEHIVSRDDLWDKADADSILLTRDPPADLRKIEHLKTTHLYGDSARAEAALTGTYQLDGKQITFINNGALAAARESKAQALCLTHVPPAADQLLLLSGLTRQMMINGELVDLSDEFKVYITPPPQPDLTKIKFIDALPKDQPVFYVNQGTYPFLALGIQKVTRTGGSRPQRSLLKNLEFLKRQPVIAITENLSYADWDRLVKESEQKLALPVYVVPGKSIEKIHTAPAVSVATPSEWKPAKNSSGVIESDSPQWILEEFHIDPQDVLTLTPQVGVELLLQVERREGYDLSYKEGWLLERLLSGRFTVLIGEMSKSLFCYLESMLAAHSKYLYLNGDFQKVTGSVWWIKSSAATNIPLHAMLNVCSETALSLAGKKRKREEEAPTVTLDAKKDEVIAQFILNPNQFVLRVTGSSASGKSYNIRQAIRTVSQQGKTVLHFFGVDDYVAWRIKNPQDRETLAAVQWDHCNLSPPGALEFLRDMARRKEFYWQGEWYPAPKFILSSHRLTDPQKKHHPVLVDPLLPCLEFAALTREELHTSILRPLLSKMTNLRSERHASVERIILWAHDYIIKTLPYSLISPRELTSLCQRLTVVTSKQKFFKPLDLCRVIYEEFFGYFSEKTSRDTFWQELLGYCKIDKETPAFLADTPLHKALRSRGLDLTEQQQAIATAIERLVEMQKLPVDENFSGKWGLLLEGSSGLLKTSVPIAVLEALGFTSAPADGKSTHQRHYVNLTTCQPSILEKRIRQCFDNGWWLVWNESNFLTPSVESLLLKLIKEAIKAGKSPRLILTQNPNRAGSTPLSLRLRSLLQKIDVLDYTQQELIGFAKNKGFSRQAELIVSMFRQLQSFQKERELVIANPRHYFRLLSALKKTKTEVEPAQILTCLMATCCSPIFSPEKDAPNSQHQAIHYILEKTRDRLPVVPPVPRTESTRTRVDIFSSSSTTTSSRADSSSLYSSVSSMCTC